MSSQQHFQWNRIDRPENVPDLPYQRREQGNHLINAP